MHSPTPTNPAQRPRFSPAFYVALLAVGLFAFGITLLLPITPLYITEELGSADVWIGTATVSVAIAAVSLRIPGGSISDRLGRRRIMLVGAGLGILAGGLYLVSVNLPIFLLGRLMSGAGLGLYTVANKAFIADLAPPERRGEALGMSNSAFMLAIVVSPLLSEELKNRYGFQAVFAASLLLSAICFAVTYTLPRVLPDDQPQENVRRNIRLIFRERGTWAANIMMLGMGTVLALMFTYFPLMAERKHLFADAPGLIAGVSMGLGLSIWALVDTVVEPLAGTLSDHIGRLRVALPGVIIAVGGLAMLSHAHDTASTYLAVIILGVGWGSARAIAESIAQDAVAPALRGISAAMIYTSFDIAVGANAQILGTLINGSDFSVFFQVAGAILLAFSVLGLVLSTRLVTYEQRTARQHQPAGD